MAQLLLTLLHHMPYAAAYYLEIMISSPKRFAIPLTLLWIWRTTGSWPREWSGPVQSGRRLHSNLRYRMLRDECPTLTMVDFLVKMVYVWPLTSTLLRSTVNAGYFFIAVYFFHQIFVFLLNVTLPWLPFDP